MDSTANTEKVTLTLERETVIGSLLVVSHLSAAGWQSALILRLTGTSRDFKGNRRTDSHEYIRPAQWYQLESISEANEMLPAHKLKDVTVCKQLKQQSWTAEPSDALDVYGNLLLVPNSQLSKGGLVCQKF